jgi:hypothetical protein
VKVGVNTGASMLNVALIPYLLESVFFLDFLDFFFGGFALLSVLSYTGSVTFYT